MYRDKYKTKYLTVGPDMPNMSLGNEVQAYGGYRYLGVIFVVTGNHKNTSGQENG